MLVFEYAEKGDLQHYLREHFAQLTWKKRLIMLNSLAKNLWAIHNAGFTHYDLHPGNVLIMSEIKTVICDFGLARHLDDSLNSKVYGIVPYISPAIMTRQIYNRTAYIYSFRIVMW